MSDRFIPSDPLNIPLPTFEKGIFADRSTLKIPPSGGVLDAKNLHIIDNCMKRRPSVERFILGNSGTHLNMSYVPRGGALLWKIDGTVVNALWDEKQLYDYASPSLLVKSWVYNTGTVTLTSGHFTVNGSGTSWAATAQYIRAGDLMSIAGEPAGSIFSILSLISNTRVVLDRAVTTGGAGKAYNIKRAFGTAAVRFLDWCVADSKLILADASRPFYSYDGTTFTKFGDATWYPKTVGFFMNRIWGGHIQEGVNTYRQRLRWSQIIDHTAFLSVDGTDSNWVDINVTPANGAIQRILPLGNMLMVYGEDFIYSCIPQNVVNAPVSPVRIESGGVGLVGMRALTPFIGAHFFVGQDDVYQMTATGITRIGSQIVKKTIRNSKFLHMVQSAVDLDNERIIFGFPELSSDIVKLWSYFYKTEGWTYDEIQATALMNVGVTGSLNWDSLTTPLLPADNWDVGMAKWTSWDAMYQPNADVRVLLGQANGKVYAISKGGSQDEFTPATNIGVTLEIGDYNHELPDEEKTWLRLSMQMRDIATENITFNVEVSNNKGSVYKNVGTLTIYAGTSEGYINFRSTGSLLRVRFTSAQKVEPYSIEEVLLRVRARGLETRAVAT